MMTCLNFEQYQNMFGQTMLMINVIFLLLTYLMTGIMAMERIVEYKLKTKINFINF